MKVTETKKRGHLVSKNFAAKNTKLDMYLLCTFLASGMALACIVLIMILDLGTINKSIFEIFFWGCGSLSLWFVYFLYIK